MSEEALEGAQGVVQAYQSGLNWGERQPPEGQYALDMSAPPSEEAIASGLFDDPPTPPDCPICMVRLPCVAGLITYAPCCGKKICTACSHENAQAFEKKNQKRADKNLALLENAPCPFCRTPSTDDDDPLIKRFEKRAEMDDPIAIFMLSSCYRNGGNGIVQDEAKALDFTRRSADLGVNDAQFVLANDYREGKIGLDPDNNVSRMYYELDAKGGHVGARHELGCLSTMFTFNNVTRESVMHFRIAAAGGFTYSFEYLLHFFEDGYIRHQDLAPSLPAIDKALLEMKSESREKLLRAIAALRHKAVHT